MGSVRGQNLIGAYFKSWCSKSHEALWKVLEADQRFICGSDSGGYNGGKAVLVLTFEK